jgi:hypothetical protein
MPRLQDSAETKERPGELHGLQALCRPNVLHLREAVLGGLWEEGVQGVHCRGGPRKRFLVPRLPAAGSIHEVNGEDLKRIWTTLGIRIFLAWRIKRLGWHYSIGIHL